MAVPPRRPGYCWVCEQFRAAPMKCGDTCMEQDYPDEAEGT